MKTTDEAPRANEAPGLPRARLAALSLLALAFLFTAAASSASADSRIGVTVTPPPGEAGRAGGISRADGLAVSDREAGDIYLLDAASNQRVDQFQPDGTFVRAFGWGVLDGAPELQTCTTTTGCQGGSEGSGPGQLDWSDEIAVDDDPTSASYGDVYVVDQRNFRVEKYNPEGRLLLMFGGGVDKGPHHPGDLCTAAFIGEGDTCGAGVPGTGPAHFYREEPKSWGNEGSNSIAVGPGGIVYVGDYGRIQEFTPDGSFAGEFKLPDAEPRFVSSLAIDSGGDLFERSATYSQFGDTLLSQIPGVREFGPGPPHPLLRTFDTEETAAEPTHIALDPAGDLFVADLFVADSKPCKAGSNTDSCPEDVFRAFRPGGALYAEFGSPFVRAASGAIPRGIASGASALYAPSVHNEFQTPDCEHVCQETYVAAITEPASGPPIVEPGSEEATDLEPTTATLRAVANPEGFETAVGFQYLTAAEYQANPPGERFRGARETTTTHLHPLIKDDPVVLGASGLAPQTAYRFRAVATSECNGPSPEPLCQAFGEDRELTTLPPVSIRGLTTRLVAPEEVKLTAELANNNSLDPGHWEICLGSDTSYAAGCVGGGLPAGSSSFEPVEAAFGHLSPDTSYHYILRAENQYTPLLGHPTESADQTFTTEPSAAEERAGEDCPANGTVHGELRSTLREENGSAALPDCRAYEQVSEPVKEGGQAFAQSDLAPSGERDLYQSNGIFAGAEGDDLTITYLARRTASGWTTMPVVRQVEPHVAAQLSFFKLLFAPELDRWLIPETLGLDHEEAHERASRGFFSLGTASGSFLFHASPELSLTPEETPGVAFELMDARPTMLSGDLSRIYLVQEARLLPAPLDPRPGGPLESTPLNTDASDSTRIYEVSGLGTPAASIRLVTEVPPGLAPAAGTNQLRCAIDDSESGSSANPGTTYEDTVANSRLASADGSTILYTEPLEGLAGAACGEGTPNPIALFARTGEAPPLRLDSPSPAQCHSPAPCAVAGPRTPRVLGISPDARRAWFTTARPLVDSDTDSTGDLYLARLDEGGLTELVQASAGEAGAAHPNPGEGAEVEGVQAMSSDGSHVAFTAAGVLTTAPDAAGFPAVEQLTPTQGAKNLYVYDADSGQTKFVASIEPENASLTPDGRYLVFQTAARLAPDDTDAQVDVYRYDLASGRLIRLSFGRDGNDAAGNDPAHDAGLTTPGVTIGRAAEGAADGSRSISADGALVVFQTDAPLVSRDTNGADDVYQWEEAAHGSCPPEEAAGCISLISSGVSSNPSSDPLVSSSGRDIVFHTLRGLVPGDTDGVGDIYDAREGGGFPYVAPRGPSCAQGSAEACHGEGTHESVPINPLSEGFVGPGNGPTETHCAKGRHKVRRHGQVRCVPDKHRRKKAHHKKQRHKTRNRHRRVGRNQGSGK